mmetsp:Transcript_113880/g.219158  ORF Transcript_113880/g.219158 Transcript_113880/m.219158 type:complete len:338 (-) Transcript_113880:512-1525(-)
MEHLSAQNVSQDTFSQLQVLHNVLLVLLVGFSALLARLSVLCALPDATLLLRVPQTAYLAPQAISMRIQGQQDALHVLLVSLPTEVALISVLFVYRVRWHLCKGRQPVTCAQVVNTSLQQAAVGAQHARQDPLPTHQAHLSASCVSQVAIKAAKVPQHALLACQAITRQSPIPPPHVYLVLPVILSHPVPLPNASCVFQAPTKKMLVPVNAPCVLVAASQMCLVLRNVRAVNLVQLLHRLGRPNVSTARLESISQPLVAVSVLLVKQALSPRIPVQQHASSARRAASPICLVPQSVLHARLAISTWSLVAQSANRAHQATTPTKRACTPASCALRAK